MSLNTHTNSLKFHYAQNQTSGKRRFKQTKEILHQKKKKDITLISTLTREKENKKKEVGGTS